MNPSIWQCFHAKNGAAFSFQRYLVPGRAAGVARKAKGGAKSMMGAGPTQHVMSMVCTDIFVYILNVYLNAYLFIIILFLYS